MQPGRILSTGFSKLSIYRSIKKEEIPFTAGPRLQFVESDHLEFLELLNLYEGKARPVVQAYALLCTRKNRKIGAVFSPSSIGCFLEGGILVGRDKDVRACPGQGDEPR